MAKRASISKKTRFEVFKRDSFTCQYCGHSAPDVVLNIDHIHPVSDCGTNELINLVTSCFDCNSGKSNRTLSDGSVAKKQIDQLKLFNERQEQLKLMAKWRSQMVDIEEQKVEAIAEACNKEMASANRVVTESYKKDIRTMLKKYTMEEIWEAIDKSSNQYLIDPKNAEDRAKFLDYVPRICYWQKRERENPIESELRRIAFMTQKFWWRCDGKDFQHRLIHLHTRDGVPVDYLRSAVKASTGITQFEDKIQAYFDGE